MQKVKELTGNTRRAGSWRCSRFGRIREQQGAPMFDNRIACGV